LSWQERLQIAHDISHGIEYLHEGVRYQLIIIKVCILQIMGIDESYGYVS
jgi:hypothetical protein